MQWLLNNYFLPTLNPSSVPHLRGPHLRPLLPLLKQYKTLLKLTTRDTSLKERYRPKIRSVLREIERWIAEAKVSVMDFDWDEEKKAASEDLDIKDKWALHRLCDGLLEKGALVPLSKKSVKCADILPLPVN
jgi:ribosomal biogenesis protein LAS1